ncbi:alpha/beta hydrolase [Aeromicrobium sp.]|uniref:esterase/lipase family protein n=1 Tax=Aeromicrobium sp. TaxID=1871063 RepID=UPI0030C27AB8
MYDFESETGPTPGSYDARTPHGPPSALLTALELPRWIGEYASSRVLDTVSPTSNLGEGRSVLVLPGFSANDFATGRLRAHLRQRGFRAHGWRLGRNVGLTDRLVDGLMDRFVEVADSSDEAVSIIGWSFGGLLARRIAHAYPDRVRQIICLGSPWRADGERTRATAMFERSRIRHGLSDQARDIVDELRQPVPVPTTAIWSRSDGVTSWAGCTVDETTTPVIAENIEVVSSHVGMVASPLVLAVVVNRLRQDPEAWQRFEWRHLLAPAAPDTKIASA